MKENYINQIRRELAVSHKQKKEIVRDLNEAFASALEHGETEQQVVERLGSPKDFSSSIHEQLGIDCNARWRRKRSLSVTMAALIAAVAFSISFLIKALRIPGNSIGQADSMTSLKVEGAALDPLIFFSLLGLAALVAAVMLAIPYIRRKWRRIKE